MTALTTPLSPAPAAAGGTGSRAGATPSTGVPGGGAGPAPRGPAGPGPGRGRGGARPASRGRPRPVAELAHGFAELFCEVEAGQRPRRQLETVMSPLLAARLSPVWVRPGPRGRVVALRGGFVGPDRYAAVAVVRRGRRCGALALELERRRGTWTVVEAARPEDGTLPVPDGVPPLAEVDSFDLVGLGR